MTLRIKTLLVGGFTLIALIGVLYSVSAIFLMEGFALIEKQETTESVQRAEHGFNNVMSRMNDNIFGWGQWDESVHFVRTDNLRLRQAYVDENLTDGLIAQFKSDFVIYLRNSGQLVFGTGFNRVAHKKTALPSGLLPYLAANNSLLRHKNALDIKQGIVMLANGPLLLISRPIVNNDGVGPSYGSLICGRFLNSSEIDQIIEAVQLPLSVQQLNSAKLPFDFQQAYSHLSPHGTVFTHAVDEGTIAGYTILEDINDKPALLLRVETKRDIHQQGLLSLRFVLVVLITIGLIGGGLALWFLERNVLSRLSHLSHSVEQISANGDISARVPAIGSDELSKLAESVNQLLVTAENGQRELRVEIAERQNVEQALRESRDELETRVEERTTQYLQANEQLQAELVQRQRTSENLRQAQQMLQLVMNHIPQAIFWKDINSVFLGCNNSFAQNAGYSSPEMLVGLNDFDIADEKNAEAYRADDREVMDADTAKLNIEEPMTKADGTKIWLRTNKIPLHDSTGAVVGILASYEDITVKKADEEAILQARKEADKANAAKSEFLSRMSHELRTPLNAILGFGQILEMQELPQRAREGVGYILKGGRHLLDLINEVLDISRVESGRLELSIEAVSLAEIISESCDLVRPIATEHKIHLYENTASFAKYHVLADQQRLKQVFINLLSNAIKYNSVEGEVTVTATMGTNGRVKIAVNDTGLGIAEEDINKLFIPFERLTATYSKIEGTGLGLALSQKLIQAMGGTLEVQSALGQGSTFSISLPRATSPIEALDSSIIVESPELESAATTQRQYTVLYIEDNLSNYRLIELLLEKRPEIKLMSAMQGNIGLDLARQYIPDLILLDLNLPDIHGTEVLAALHQYPATRDIPVIVISADVTPGQIERLSKMGTRGYLGKPLNVNEFLHSVNEVLAGESEADSPVESAKY